VDNLCLHVIKFVSDVSEGRSKVAAILFRFRRLGILFRRRFAHFLQLFTPAALSTVVRFELL